MLLAIDVGNTNTVFAIFDGQKKEAEWRCSTKEERTADEYFVWLKTLMELSSINFKDITSVFKFRPKKSKDFIENHPSYRLSDNVKGKLLSAFASSGLIREVSP